VRASQPQTHRDAPGGLCTSHKDEGCNVACLLATLGGPEYSLTHECDLESNP